jgi:hypothetical protein
MTVSRTYTTTPGTHIFYHPSLSGARILGFKRFHKIHKRVASVSPGDWEFSFILGRLRIDPNNPFRAEPSSPLDPVGGGEKIWVLYEI